MTQPAQSAFPEFGAAHLTTDCRAHLLGAMDSNKAAHTALLAGDLRRSLIEMDKAIALTHEARKFVLAPAHPLKP